MDRVALNTQVMRMAKRAEKAPSVVLRDSFVPVPSLLAQLQVPEHQVVYGRRGTGKTHLLRYLGAQQASDGCLVVYLDLRQAGAAEDVFSARQEAFADRATQLLVDVLEQVHNQIYEQVLTDAWSGRLAELSVALDSLADAATRVRVVGESELVTEQEASDSANRSASVQLHLPDPQAAWQVARGRASSQRRTERRLDRGQEHHHVLLGPLTTAIRAVVEAVDPAELWLLIDEWSAVPIEVQPLLADLLRRTFIAVNGVTVKISALHGRSRFIANDDSGTMRGLELGADTSATVDLDDFLTFHNDAATALTFYATLLHRHLSATTTRVRRTSEIPGGVLSTPSTLLKYLFTQMEAFHRLVVAAEAIPRDALQIAGLAAAGAYERPIGVEDIESATRAFFLRDKDDRIPSQARLAYSQIAKHCAQQKSRVIPLRRDGESDDDVIRLLYDARVLHRVRQGISVDPDQPATLYDIYLLDYGAFLGLDTPGRNGGLDPGARFADNDQIDTRSRLLTRRPPRWYSTRAEPPRRKR